MHIDMLDRLRADPGTRTFGELAQERQWALQEIHRLRAVLARENAARSKYLERSERRASDSATNPIREPFSPGQFLSLPEVSKRLGLSRSTIYRMQAENRFPKPTHVGLRSVRWKFEDLIAWEESLRL